MIRLRHDSRQQSRHASRHGSLHGSRHVSRQVSRHVSRRVSWARPAGFTLIELIITLAIMAILAGLAMPRYAESVNHYRVSASARKVAADLGYAQSRALAVSATRVMSFNATTSNYQLLGEPDPVVPANIYTVDLTAAPFATAISSVNFNGAGTVSFNGYGMPSSGGSIVLQSGDATATVSLDGTTGVVTIQ